MKIITQADKKTINELYYKLKSYAAVSRATGFSPATVKKYVVAGYEPVEEVQVVRFNRPLPEFDPTIFRIPDWAPLCMLADEELESLPELWKELEF